MVDTKANAPTQRVREAHDKASGRGGRERRASAPEEEDEEDQSVERASAGGNTWQCPNKHEA